MTRSVPIRSQTERQERARSTRKKKRTGMRSPHSTHLADVALTLIEAKSLQHGSGG